MGMWGMLTIIGVALIIVITTTLFFEPARSGDFNKRSLPAAATRSHPAPHE
jgi:hypothetical protein